MRIAAEFVLAARKDMGDDVTALTAIDVLGMTIKDTYDNREFFEALALPLPQVYKRYSWTPPWERSASEMKVVPIVDVDKLDTN